jgi:exonuclease SbcD
MKVLHTSDWHLGRSLYGQKRYHEFAAFLDWLIDTINDKQVDVLLVAGDVFDTHNPSNKAQQLYYDFLCKVATSSCKHVVVIAGNHDSPSFLSAPKQILKALNVHLVGAMSDSLEDEVIVLTNEQQAIAIVCAVPYLRDKDLRLVEAGESIDDKNRKLAEGLKQHYQAVCAIAEQKQVQLQQQHQLSVPIIGMGHLFTAGGQTLADDGVRELYVGSLAYIGVDAFPTCIDYMALGHLHVPQRVGGSEHIRYCGSPIAMGFGEAKQQKQVVVIEFADHEKQIEQVDIPCFWPLVKIEGELATLIADIELLKQQQSQAWLEIEYTGKQLFSDVRQSIDDVLKGS